MSENTTAGVQANLTPNSWCTQYILIDHLLCVREPCWGVSTQCRARQVWPLATCSLHFHSFYIKCLLCARYYAKTDTKNKDRPSCSSFPEARVRRPQGVSRWPPMIRLPFSVDLPRSSWYPPTPLCKHSHSLWEGNIITDELEQFWFHRKHIRETDPWKSIRNNMSQGHLPLSHYK